MSVELDPALRHELDRIATDCIAVRVRLINRVISAIYDDAFRPHALRISQGNILVVVARCQPIRPVDLCRSLRIEKSTLSRDVDLMKRRGWLTSNPSSGGRNQVLETTPQGLTLLATVLPAWKQAQKTVGDLLDNAGLLHLNQIAARLGFTEVEN